MRNRTFGIIFLLLLISGITLFGQKNVNSPYSRFNIGTLSQSGPFRSLAMGGVGVAMRDDNSIYYYNPASFTSIDTISFLFDFGADMSIVNLDAGSDKFRSVDINFNHLLMGFPVSKKFGFAAGLVPLSNGYYYMADAIKPGEPGYDPLTGEVTNVHKGSGSFSTLFAGTGFKVTRHLSVGVNMNVVFGSISRLNQFEFADFANTYNQNAKQFLRINGIHFDYGFQYHTPVKKDYFITIGASYTAAGRAASSMEVLATKFTAYTGTGIDTLAYSNSESRDSTKFPASYKGGISFGKTDKFTIEVNYVYTAWANAMIHGNNSYLANTSSWMIGAEFIPDKYSNSNFLNRVEYRIGARMSDNYLKINGVQLKEYGLTAGMGIRMRGSPSKANIFFDYTRTKGDPSQNLFNENTYSIGISLSLYDWWFRKKMYD